MLNVFSKVFGTRNDRVVKKYKNIANEITNLEGIYSKLSDDELKAKFNEFKKLWSYINSHATAKYELDSTILIDNIVRRINNELDIKL